MALDTWVARFNPITFGLLIVFGIVELSISAFLTSMYNKHHNYLHTDVRDCARYLLFASIWTVIFSTAYLGLYLHSPDGSIATSIVSHLGFLSVTWIFWLAGAWAITSALNGGHDCSTINYELPYCNQLNALEGFAWVEWVITTFALIIIVALTVRAVRRGDGYRSPIITV